MCPISRKYLLDYIDAVNNIRCEDHIYGELANWQYCENMSGRQSRAAQGINQKLNFRVRTTLRGDHPATTAVGRLDGLVIISSNPGFTWRNELEAAYRQISPANNALLCRRLFGTYPNVVRKAGSVEGRNRRTVAYWTKALKIYQLAMRNKDVPGNDAPSLRYWDLAANAAEDEAPDWVLGGVDLFPLHSNQDGVSENMVANGQYNLLREVGFSTLRMLLRLPRPVNSPFAKRVLLVSSSAGAKLVRELGHDIVGKWRDVGPVMWHMQIARAGEHAVILSIPYQVFSFSFPRGWDRNRFAQEIWCASSVA